MANRCDFGTPKTCCSPRCSAAIVTAGIVVMLRSVLGTMHAPPGPRQTAARQLAARRLSYAIGSPIVCSTVRRSPACARHSSRTAAQVQSERRPPLRQRWQLQLQPSSHPPVPASISTAHSSLQAASSQAAASTAHNSRYWHGRESSVICSAAASWAVADGTENSSRLPVVPDSVEVRKKS